MQIKTWKKVGEPEILAKSYGRSFQLQKFEDPYTQEIKEYSQLKGTDFASIVLAITTGGQVLLVKQYRQAPEMIFLELPGGNPKYKGQSPESVAREEVAEETAGYTPETIVSLGADDGPCWLDPACFVTPFYPFLFTGCRKTNYEARLDKGEYAELVKIPLEQWIEMCFTGQIPDSKSVTITFLALRYLGFKIQKCPHNW